MATEFCSMTIYVREQQTNQFMADTIDDVVQGRKKVSCLPSNFWSSTLKAASDHCWS